MSNEVVLSIIKKWKIICVTFTTFYAMADSPRAARAADQARRRNQLKKKQVGFADPSRSVFQVMHDLELFRSHFESLAKELPPLRPAVEEEAPAPRSRASAARKAQEEGAREPPTPQRTPLKLQVPCASLRHRPGSSGQARRGLQEKLSEALELRRLSLAKKRQGLQGRPSGNLARTLARSLLLSKQLEQQDFCLACCERSPAQALARRPRRPLRAAARAARQASLPSALPTLLHSCGAK